MTTHKSEPIGTTQSPTEEVVVGVVADPVATTLTVAKYLERELPGLLAEQLSDGHWRVEVHRERLPPSDGKRFEMMDLAAERMREHGWDLAVCVTDLILLADRRPVVADANHSRNVAVVSLPAFGAMSLRRRVSEVVTQLIRDMRGGTTPKDGSQAHRRSRVPALGGAFELTTPDQDGVDFRIFAKCGRLRLLVGMVRDNRPWRLVSGLRGALVGAFAFSAFYLLNTTLWELALTMAAWQLVAVVVASITVMITWLIVYHHLWERAKDLPPQERERAVLFNASTVLTLAIGVTCGYAGLFVLNLTAALIVFTPEVFSQYAGDEYGLGEYLLVTLFATAAAKIAGAIGSGFESEESVLEAAYSYRERARREARRRSRSAENNDSAVHDAAQNDDASRAEDSDAGPDH